MTRCPVRSSFTLFFLAALTIAGCGGGDNGDAPRSGGPPPDANPGLPPTISLTPENTGDGWTTSTPAAEGLDPVALEAVMNAIRSGQFPGVDSMIVARDQRLVAEGYFNGFGRDSLHDLRSTGKSFTAALTGIAVEQALLSIDDPISQHLPDFESHDHMDARKRAITLRHLLHMSSGLACNDWDAGSPGNEENMYGTRDWVGFILDLRMIADPGTASSYCTGGVVVLGYVLSLRSGQALDDYAQSYLFAPLGIQQSIWRRTRRPRNRRRRTAPSSTRRGQAGSAVRERRSLERHARDPGKLGDPEPRTRHDHWPRWLRLFVVEAQLPARIDHVGKLIHVR